MTTGGARLSVQGDGGTRGPLAHQGVGQSEFLHAVDVLDPGRAAAPTWFEREQERDLSPRQSFLADEREGKVRAVGMAWAFKKRSVVHLSEHVATTEDDEITGRVPISRSHP
jgi:hypothetical protein